MSWASDAAQAAGRERRQALVLDDVGRGHAAARKLLRGISGPRPDEDRVDGLARCDREAAGEAQCLEREALRAALGVLDEREDHRPITPSRVSSSTTAGAAAAPLPMTSTVLSSPWGSRSRSFVGPPGRARRRHPHDLLLLRPEPPRHRRIARQVQALLHRQDRRHRQLEHLPTAARLAPGDHPSVRRLDRLDARHDRPAQGGRHPDPHLEVAGIGRLVAEQEQVERLALRLEGADRVDDRRGRCHRVPVGAVGLEQDGVLDADRHRVAELLARNLRAEGQDRRAAALGLHDPDRLLDRALLVRADGEAQVAGVDVRARRA